MEKSILSIPRIKRVKPGKIVLPSSKSVHNRATIVKHLSGGGTELTHPSNARDSVLMNSLIASDNEVIDAQDAGTTFRFLTAFYALSGTKRVLQGTERMHQRPIGELVNSLRKVGAEISYLGEEGYPPLSISGFNDSDTHEISMRGDISSQYISAMMMIAPLLNKGLIIHLTGEVGSRPYIQMTGNILQEFGVPVDFQGNTVYISHTDFNAPDSLSIEPDWSAASYWYSLVAIGGYEGIVLDRLQSKAIQGDRVIVEIMETLGVLTEFKSDGAHLIPSRPGTHLEFDYTDCPDLAQTVAVTCAAKGIPCKMTGLESLRIKETDRIQALVNELAKFNIRFTETNSGWEVAGDIDCGSDPVRIETYEDHRMAMAFAPLCALTDLEIIDPGVVAKSYPHFWDDLESVRA